MKFLFFSLLISSGFCEVIHLSYKNPPATALKNFEFTVINFVDDSNTSQDASMIFEEAESIFAQESRRAERIGWG